MARGGDTAPHQVSHAEFSRVLRRAGYSPAVIKEIVAQLPDPIDADRDASVLQGYGLTVGHLTDLMGGSP